MTAAPLLLASLLATGEAAPPDAQRPAEPQPTDGVRSARRGSELRVRMGGYRPSLGRSAQDEGGFDVEGALARGLIRGLDGEVAVGWYGTRLLDFHDGYGTVRTNLNVIPITASLRLVARPTDAVSLSAFAGGGVHVMFVESRISDVSGLVSRRTTHAAPAAHVGTAIFFKVGPVVGVGVELRQSFASVRALGEQLPIRGRHLGVTLAFGT